ncbi:PA4642 family protein [Pseudomonadales bacterium]|nr:PA4642 family protein [Pseudomonadales bacterium]
MALKKDKEKVIDPVWGEERIREFLDLQAPTGENADHHKMLKAYQSMRPEDFATFVDFFAAAKGNLDAKDLQGKTVSELISSHRYSQPYLDAIAKHR